MLHTARLNRLFAADHRCFDPANRAAGFGQVETHPVPKSPHTGVAGMAR
jgi:hypothetical protein